FLDGHALTAGWTAAITLYPLRGFARASFGRLRINFSPCLTTKNPACTGLFVASPGLEPGLF
ncbi:MAG: hypothetical protein JW965_08455, partial [Bacteroidales bacterium]|nr:hypothetical protein [Bacteroidales bacterium]